jgi:uncharacterized protein
VLPYVLVTFAWTWTWWWTIATVTGLPAGLRSLLFLTGGLGPLLGAAWLVRRADASYRRGFLRRVWDPRGIALRWWIALLALSAGPALVGAIVAALLGAEASRPDRRVTTVSAIVIFALAAGLVEEPGWRGAALDALQARMHPALAAVGIGVVWAFWHLPLYFQEGSYQHGLGFGSPRFWLTNLVLVELGVLYVWLANGASGSILLPILAHAGFNAAGELVPRSTVGDLVAFLVVTVATVVVLVGTRGTIHARRPGSRA